MRTPAPPLKSERQQIITDGYQICAKCGKVMITGDAVTVVPRAEWYLIFSHPECRGDVRGWSSVRDAETIQSNNEPTLFRLLPCQHCEECKSPVGCLSFDPDRSNRKKCLWKVDGICALWHGCIWKQDGKCRWSSDSPIPLHVNGWALPYVCILDDKRLFLPDNWRTDPKPDPVWYEPSEEHTVRLRANVSRIDIERHLERKILKALGVCSTQVTAESADENSGLQRAVRQVLARNFVADQYISLLDLGERCSCHLMTSLAVIVEHTARTERSSYATGRRFLDIDADTDSPRILSGLFKDTFNECLKKKGRDRDVPQDVTVGPHKRFQSPLLKIHQGSVHTWDLSNGTAVEFALYTGKEPKSGRRTSGTVPIETSNGISRYCDCGCAVLGTQLQRDRRWEETPELERWLEQLLTPKRPPVDDESYLVLPDVKPIIWTPVKYRKISTESSCPSFRESSFGSNKTPKLTTGNYHHKLDVVDAPSSNGPCVLTPQQLADWLNDLAAKVGSDQHHWVEDGEVKSDDPMLKFSLSVARWLDRQGQNEAERSAEFYSDHYPSAEARHAAFQALRYRKNVT